MGAMNEIGNMQNSSYTPGRGSCRVFALLFGMFVCAVPVPAETVTAPQDADPDAMFALQHHDRVDALYEAWKKEYDGKEDLFVRRGLKADREAQQIELLADASGLPPRDPLEFVIISERSGHDYEALAVSYARPSDLHEALEFIGMEAGAPMDPSALRFFPKGERVVIHFSWTDEDGAEQERRAEELIMDARTESALPKEGFVFVGSQRIEEDGEQVYAADAYGPQAIVSIYNEPTTVLDVPRAVAQRDVYGLLHPYPERQAPYGALLRIRLEPEFTDGRQRVADVTLDIRSGPPDAPVRLTLSDAEDVPLHDEPALHEVLAALNRISEQEQTPFVALRIDEDIPLNELRDLFELLRRFQQKGELQMEPPQPGDLFYRAFLPVEAHRDRANRPSQALELHLDRTDDGLTGRVVEIEDQRRRREDPFDPDITEHKAETPEALEAVLDTIQHRLPVLLVFAPADLSYGAVMEWVRPVLDSHPMIHLFL